MNKRDTGRFALLVFAASSVLSLAGSLPAHAQTSKHYTLAATPENVQWGWYDPTEKPRLRIHSGDTVSIEETKPISKLKRWIVIDGASKG